MLPTKDEERPTCTCKKCGKEYIAAGAYVGFNLKRHLGVCPRKFQVPLSIPGSTVADVGNAFFLIFYLYVGRMSSNMMIF